MRRALCKLLLLVAPALAAAQTPDLSPADAGAIRAVIESRLEDYRQHAVAYRPPAVAFEAPIDGCELQRLVTIET